MKLAYAVLSSTRVSALLKPDDDLQDSPKLQIVTARSPYCCSGEQNSHVRMYQIICALCNDACSYACACIDTSLSRTRALSLALSLSLYVARPPKPNSYMKTQV